MLLVIFCVVSQPVWLLAWLLSVLVMGDLRKEPKSAIGKAWIYGPVILVRAIVDCAKHVVGL